MGSIAELYFSGYPVNGTKNYLDQCKNEVKMRDASHILQPLDLINNDTVPEENRFGHRGQDRQFGALE